MNSSQVLEKPASESSVSQPLRILINPSSRSSLKPSSPSPSPSPSTLNQTSPSAKNGRTIPTTDKKTDETQNPNPSSSSSDPQKQRQPTDSKDLDTSLDPIVIDAMKNGTLRDKQILLQAEVEMTKFIGSNLPKHPFGPALSNSFNSYQRMLVHRLGDSFGIKRSLEFGHLIMERTPTSACPPVRLESLIVKQDASPSNNSGNPSRSLTKSPSDLSTTTSASAQKEEQQQQQLQGTSPSPSQLAGSSPSGPPKAFKIMSRSPSQRSNSRLNGKTLTTSSASPALSADGSQSDSKRNEMTYEARQAAYQEARNRIFANSGSQNGVGGSTSSSTSSSGAGVDDDSQAVNGGSSDGKSSPLKTNSQNSSSSAQLGSQNADSLEAKPSSNLASSGSRPNRANPKLRPSATVFDPTAKAHGYEEVTIIDFGNQTIPCEVPHHMLANPIASFPDSYSRDPRLGHPGAPRTFPIPPIPVPHSFPTQPPPPPMHPPPSHNYRPPPTNQMIPTYSAAIPPQPLPPPGHQHQPPMMGLYQPPNEQGPSRNNLGPNLNFQGLPPQKPQQPHQHGANNPLDNQQNSMGNFQSLNNENHLFGRFPPQQQQHQPGFQQQHHQALQTRPNPPHQLNHHHHQQQPLQNRQNPHHHPHHQHHHQNPPKHQMLNGPNQMNYPNPNFVGPKFDNVTGGNANMSDKMFENFNNQMRISQPANIGSSGPSKAGQTPNNNISFGIGSVGFDGELGDSSSRRKNSFGRGIVSSGPQPNNQAQQRLIFGSLTSPTIGKNNLNNHHHHHHPQHHNGDLRFNGSSQNHGVLNEINGQQQQVMKNDIKNVGGVRENNLNLIDPVFGSFGANNNNNVTKNQPSGMIDRDKGGMIVIDGCGLLNKSEEDDGDDGDGEREGFKKKKDLGPIGPNNSNFKSWNGNGFF